MGEVGVANGLAALVEHRSGCKLDRLQMRLKASKVVRLQSRQEPIGAMPGRAWGRAVQRSLHGPQREHCIDASDSDAIAPVTHVVHVVEAEDVGGEGSQASEDAGVAADPTVVLAEADIADIVQSVLNPPMAADGVSAGCGGQSDVSK